MNGQVGQHFAVNLNLRFLQAVGKLAVGHAALTRSGVDTCNPKLAEHTLFGTAVAVGVLPSLHHRFFGDAEDITAAAAETFSEC